MTKTLLSAAAIAVLALTIGANPAHAQYDEESKSTIWLTGVAGLPLLDFADGAGIGIGGTGRIRYQLGTALGVSAGTGFIYHLKKNDITTFQIPLFVGLEYSPKPKIFIIAEGGLNFIRASAAGASNTDTKIGGNFGVGYELGRLLDARATLQLPSIPDIGDGFQIMVGLSYRLIRL